MKLKDATALFEITNACNMQCRHCYKRDAGEQDLTLEQIKTIIGKITEFGIRHVVLTGGEPFLRKDLFKIIEYAGQNHIEDIVINTNGTLLNNSEVITGVNEHKDLITGLPVSFDGARSETHDFIRGAGQFTKLIKILENDLLANWPLGVNVTIGKWNFDDLHKFFELYDKLDAEDINFGIFIPSGKGDKLKDQVLLPEQCDSLITIAKQKKEAGYEVELCSVPYSNLFAKDLSGACCHIFTDFISITAQGNVIPCMLYDFDCGSILEMEMDDIFANPLVELFREPKKLQKKMNRYCNQCHKFSQCNGGCNLLTYALTGTIFESDPLCPLQHKDRET
ncbi:MAG TPA: radical SAM protein [Candidatus Deferrimicrobium sp.]|nr:radical SAM protein [Candidatus Deferrimicrobium sp.]